MSAQAGRFRGVISHAPVELVRAHLALNDIFDAIEVGYLITSEPPGLRRRIRHDAHLVYVQLSLAAKQAGLRDDALNFSQTRAPEPESTTADF